MGDISTVVWYRGLLSSLWSTGALRDWGGGVRWVETKMGVERERERERGREDGRRGLCRIHACGRSRNVMRFP